MKVTLEKEGNRYYVTGDTFALKNKLKEAGFRWDSHRRAWWTADQALATTFEGEFEPEDATEARTVETRSSAICTGKVTYNDKTYYIIGHSSDGQKINLTPLNCQIDFWVERDNCTLTKEYRSHSFQGKKTHQTVGSIREFVNKLKADNTEPNNTLPSSNYVVAATPQEAVSAAAPLPENQVYCCYCGELTARNKDWCFNCRKAGYQ